MNDYSVTVRVHDGYGPDYQSTDVGVDATITVTITVTAARSTTRGGGGGGSGAPQNRSPAFTDGAKTDRSVAENTPAGADIGEPVAATDREDDTLTYSLRGADAESFGIDPATGQLLTKAPLDHEAQAAYSVIVAVSDGKSSSGRESDSRDDSITVTIDVENADEPGAVALSSHQPQVAVALTAALTDPDGGVARITWLWERSADQADWTEIDGAASDAYTPVIGDLSSYLRATASYEDGHGRGKSAEAVTGDPVLINTVPRFPSMSIAIEVEEGSGDAESGGVGSPVAAADPGGDTLTYSLSGADAAVLRHRRVHGAAVEQCAPRLRGPGRTTRSWCRSATAGTSTATPTRPSTPPSTVTIAVVNVAEPGTLTLPSSPPRVGVPFAARLTDPDGVVGEVVWQVGALARREPVVELVEGHRRGRVERPTRRWRPTWATTCGARRRTRTATGRTRAGRRSREPRVTENVGAGVRRRPGWCVREERGGEHGRGRGRGRPGGRPRVLTAAR